ncbi:hypothetical protein DSL92_05485 [Billgrantia gudaonensis]|uniref:PAS fold-2 domain-containing protein n=1 Tax=Billgrantia gudaonensis TaxID=376427 RepID=A0A432JJ10_9GAMM|nr:hypothetical protein DSL92_05485 [Halomonas gudaonensis]
MPLICLDDQGESIHQVSANLEPVLGISPEQAFGESPRRLLGDSLIDRLVQALATTQRIPESLSAVLSGQRRFQVTAYRKERAWSSN